MAIELEYRAVFSEEDFGRLKTQLDSKTAGTQDNKDSHFFVWPDRVVKVVFNEENKTAKMALKLGRIGEVDHFPEIELIIKPEEVAKALEFCRAFGPDRELYSYQFRRNYHYDGVDIALKYTDSWGFHVEFEILLEDLAQKEVATAKIFEIAKELNCHLMNTSELKAFDQKILAGEKFGKYSKETFPFKAM